MTLALKSSDYGRIDVFSIDLPMPEAARFAADADQLAAALGATPDPAQVDVFDTAVMGDLGLAGYLQQGIGVAASDVASYAEVLGNIDQAVVIRAAAFDGQNVILDPQPPLNHVATLYEAGARIDLTPLQSNSASGHLPPVEQPTIPAPQMSRWLWICLALLVGLLVVTVLPILFSVQP